MDRLQFYSGSRDLPAGSGAGERVQNLEDYFELNRIPNWRKVLSNFWISPFEWKGKRWNTVEHAFQAAKFMESHSSTANQFSLDSDSELSRSAGVIARKNRKVVILSVGELRIWDSKKDAIMKELWFAKFTTDSHCCKVLKETKSAQLWHYAGRSGGREHWTGLEELRESLCCT